MKGLLLSLCLFPIFLGNCGRPIDSKNDNSSNVSPSFIISDRSSRSTGNLIYLYRLENPALFASAKRDEEGNLTIDSEAQGRIQKEQEVFIEKLKKISSDIQVIYTYQFVVNGVSIATPVKYLDDIAEIQGITESKPQTIFRRPQTLTLLNDEGPAQTEEDLGETTTKHLGLDRVWEEYGITGKGIKIGIIDTGVDYTHAMLGDPGR